jgi:hypothetical protein
MSEQAKEITLVYAIADHSSLSMWQWDKFNNLHAIKILESLSGNQNSAYKTSHYENNVPSAEGFECMALSVLSKKFKFPTYNPYGHNRDLEVCLEFNIEKEFGTQIRFVSGVDSLSKFHNGILFVNAPDSYHKKLSELQGVDSSEKRIGINIKNMDIENLAKLDGGCREALNYLMDLCEQQPHCISYPEVNAFVKIDALKSIVISTSNSDRMFYDPNTKKSPYIDNPNPRALLNASFLQSEIKNRFGLDIPVELYNSDKPQARKEVKTGLGEVKQALTDLGRFLYLYENSKVEKIDYNDYTKFVDVNKDIFVPYRKYYQQNFASLEISKLDHFCRLD